VAGLERVVLPVDLPRHGRAELAVGLLVLRPVGRHREVLFRGLGVEDFERAEELLDLLLRGEAVGALDAGGEDPRPRLHPSDDAVVPTAEAALVQLQPALLAPRPPAERDAGLSGGRAADAERLALEEVLHV